MVIFASIMLIKAFLAAIEILAVPTRSAGEGLSAILAGKGCSLADMFPMFFGNTIALAFLGAKSLLAMGIPIRTILGKEFFAAEITDGRHKTACSSACLVHAITRAISALATRNILKLLAANGASVVNGDTAPSNATANAAALWRTILVMWSPVWVWASGISLPADGANTIKQSGFDLAGVIDVPAANRTELSWFRGMKSLSAYGANLVHRYTSGSIIRVMLRGARSPERTLVGG